MWRQVILQLFNWVALQPWLFSKLMPLGGAFSHFLAILLLSGLWGSCQKELSHGHLSIKFEGQLSALSQEAKQKSFSSVEIYRVIQESPLEMESVKVSSYLAPIELSVGRYLVMADCSAQDIVIKSGKTEHLTLHPITFTLPDDNGVMSDQDLLTIQCTRYEPAEMRQEFRNRLSLYLLSGHHKILVGMRSLELDLESVSPTAGSPLSFQLASLQVNASPKIMQQMDRHDQYFVTALGSFVATTQAQLLNQRIFVLEGDYEVALNGTQEQVHVQAGEQKIFWAASIRVMAPKDVDLERASNILGTPLHIEINGEHLLNLNETVSVLAGQQRLRLFGNHQERIVELQEDSSHEFHTRAVEISFHCPRFDWSCLGRRKIYLFEKEAQYPIAEGKTDVPLLYFGHDMYLGIEGSRDIRYQLDNNQDYIKLYGALIHFVPDYRFDTHAVTDLVRLESIALPYWGKSYDISLDQRSTMAVVSGRYRLASYVSWGSEANLVRKKVEQTLYVARRDEKTVVFPVYLPEKAYKKLMQRNKNLPQESHYAQRLSRYFAPTF